MTRRPVRVFPLAENYIVAEVVNRPVVYTPPPPPTDQQHYKKRWRNVKDREMLLEVMFNRLVELTEEMKEMDRECFVDR